MLQDEKSPPRFPLCFLQYRLQNLGCAVKSPRSCSLRSRDVFVHQCRVDVARQNIRIKVFRHMIYAQLPYILAPALHLRAANIILTKPQQHYRDHTLMFGLSQVQKSFKTPILVGRVSEGSSDRPKCTSYASTSSLIMTLRCPLVPG